MAENRSSPVLRITLAAGAVALLLAASEFAMRYLDRPAAVISGWRATASKAPVNPSGGLGRPTPRNSSDFVVVLTGADAVECVACPPGEPMDLIFERALRQYNPNARVVTLGARGYGQDQEYLALQGYFAHERADLVIAWTSIAADVPRNTFRSGSPRPGLTMLKPTFGLRGKMVFGPTETIGAPLYRSKLATLVWPYFVDVDQRWNEGLPPPDPGSASPPPDVAARSQIDEPLEEQRSAWSIWMTPRPARVQYGIDLMHLLLLRMRDLATLHGARFNLLRTPSAGEPQPDGRIALEHAGHWFVADPAARDAAIAEVSAGFDPITLPAGNDPAPSPEAERRIMAELAAALNQRDLLNPAVAFRVRR